MPQPSTEPRWNTDATNRTDPPSGQKDTGWTPNQVPPSSYFNWWMNLVYEWVLYLKNLASEAFTWTAAHIFTSGITVSKTAGVAITATGGTGTGAHGLNATAGSGVGSYGVRGFTSASVGTGVYGEGSGGNGTGVAGNGTQFGVTGTTDGGTAVRGYATGVGGKAGTFISDNGPGISVLPTGAIGVEVIGDGAAPAIFAVGGTTEPAISALGGSDSRGMDAIGGSNKAGVRGTGGAAGGNGLEGVGSAAGGHGVSGWATTGHGGDFTGGGAYAGVRAARGDAFTNKPAIDAFGTINLDGSSAPAVITPVKNQVTRNSIVKAWVLIQCNGTANPVILDGFNVASVVQDLVTLPGKLTITFAQAMAGTTYAVKGLCENAPAYSAEISGKAGASFNCRPFTIMTGAYPSHTVTNGQVWLFEVMGAM